MAKLGCLLMIVAFTSLCVLVVLPVLPFLAENSTLDSLLKPILCQPGETLQRQPYSEPNDEGGTSYSMNVYCLNARENKHDVTDRWEFISLISFLAPFLLGLFGFIYGVNRSARKAVVAGTAPSLNMIGLDSSNMNIETFRVSRPGQTTQSSLAERLKQIEEARDAGLISAEEYQGLRKDIINHGL